MLVAPKYQSMLSATSSSAADVYSTYATLLLRTPRAALSFMLPVADDPLWDWIRC